MQAYKLESFSSALEEAMRAISPTDDVLDSADFQPLAYINRLLPNEEALSLVETRAEDLEKQKYMLDEEIMRTVRKQTGAGSMARKDIESAKASVAELFVKVRDIKMKAMQSEQLVEEICRDIKSLDHAKRHLTQTILALKRLQMLVAAIDQLQIMTRERMYVEAANLLVAACKLMAEFDDYGKIDKIVSLQEQLEEIRTNLRVQVNRLPSRRTSWMRLSNAKFVSSELRRATQVML
jgi:hypothetical protein